MLLPNPTFFIKILNKFQLILLQLFVHLRQLLKSSKFRCFSDLELRSTVWSVLCYCVLHRQLWFFFFNPSVFGNYFVLCYGVNVYFFHFFFIQQGCSGPHINRQECCPSTWHHLVTSLKLTMKEIAGFQRERSVFCLENGSC